MVNIWPQAPPTPPPPPPPKKKKKKNEKKKTSISDTVIKRIQTPETY